MSAASETRSVVIVGAGIIGCAIARELALRGVSCTVIDDRGVAAGATHASAGMLAPYIEAHEGGPLLDLAVRSLALYADWIAAVGQESNVDVEFTRSGTLEIAASGESAAALRQAGRAHGRWLEADEVRQRFPELCETSGARFIEEHGHVVPPQLAFALAQAARRRGTAFHAARAQRITRSATSLSVETSDGTLIADTVVLAAGAWTNHIDGVGAPPIRPVRGQVVHLAWPDHPLSAIVWGPRCYLVPRGDGTIVVGATAEDAGFDERTTAEGVRGLLDAACDLVPALQDAAFLDALAGLRPAAPDGLPVLGEDRTDSRLVHASGHYRNGVLLAPITAKLIGDLVVDRDSDPCLKSFRADRFD